MSTPSIAVSPSITQYFRDAIEGAAQARRVDATEAALTYLAGVLCEYAHPPPEAESTLTEPLTFLLHDAMNDAGSSRFRKLRTLGDGVLYAAGFFGDHIDRRGADRGYVLSVGATAYDNAAAMLRARAQRAGERNPPGVLEELAARFERFVEVLSEVAETTMSAVRDERSIVKAYERWLKTGSPHLAVELGARGIVPTRGTSGVH